MLRHRRVRLIPPESLPTLQYVHVHMYMYIYIVYTCIDTCIISIYIMYLTVRTCIYMYMYMHVNLFWLLYIHVHVYSPKGHTPLSCAAEAGNDDIVGYLLVCIASFPGPPSALYVHTITHDL